MLNNFRNFIRIKRLERCGLVHGSNFSVEKGVIIDPGSAFLISIGNNVTFAPYSHVLAHDACTRKINNFTKFGKVIIGNNVFIGAKSIILPNVSIGDNVIIGAGSVVTKSIESDSVVVGNPAKKISSVSDLLDKRNKNMNEASIINRINRKIKPCDMEIMKCADISDIFYVD